MSHHDFEEPGDGPGWAPLRFAIVGPLLAAPPKRGELGSELKRLSRKLWRHPESGELMKFGFSTIERWYYEAKNQPVDPVGVLHNKVRKDRGSCKLSEEVKQTLAAQWNQYKDFSYQLHTDNLKALVEQDESLGPMPHYSTVRRYMQRTGLVRQKRRGPRGSAGGEAAMERFAKRDVQSYEVEYVHALWHVDFHQSSRAVVTPKGVYKKPQLLAVIDDHSRLCCHAQWYWEEEEETLIHGLCQAFQKRGLPRALMSDQGGAMRAAEFSAGLLRLGVLHQMTLSYSPEQNGKQEYFWTHIEGRLLPMLQGTQELTLAKLNEVTQAYIEMEYNRHLHSAIGQTPLARALSGRPVGRSSPSAESLRQAFTQSVMRTQRLSDGTLTVHGVRYEIPSRYRTLLRVYVRYARWDLSWVLLWDPRSQQVLCKLAPVDRLKNAEGLRPLREPLSEAAPRVSALPTPEIAPLLALRIAQYAATGAPPAYLPKDELREPTPSENPEQ